MRCCGQGEGKELLKELIKTFAPHPNFFFLKDDKGLRKLACWLLGTQVALEESMPSLECNQIEGVGVRRERERGGERETDRERDP